MKYYPRSYWLPVFIFLILASVASYTYSQETRVTPIVGRILSISPDGATVTINRGKNDNLVLDSLCTIFPKRGGDFEWNFKLAAKGMIASAPAGGTIEWNFELATGKIIALMPDSATIALISTRDTVLMGDYCTLYADIPPFICDTPLGVIALSDIVFFGEEQPDPLFELEDLIAHPTKEAINAIMARLLFEIKTYVNKGKWSKQTAIETGIFKGLTEQEALLSTKREHLQLFLEWLIFQREYYIFYEPYFAQFYHSWIIKETPSVDTEHKKQEAYALADEAYELILHNDLEKGIERYKESLNLYPHYDYVHRKLRLIDEISFNLKILEQDPDDPYINFTVANKYMNLGMYDYALKYFEQARDLGYDSLIILEYIGYTYVYYEKYKKAIEMFIELSHLQPNRKTIQQWLSFAQTRDFLNVNPGSVDSYIITGDMYYEEKNSDRALKEYRKALELAPNSKKIWNLINRTIIRLQAENKWADGEHFDASELCKKMGDLECTKEIMYEYARMQYEKGNYLDAMIEYTTINEYDPTDYDAHIGVSNCLRRREKYSDAILWAKKGIAIDPDDPWAYNTLGLIYKDMGNVDEQIEYLSKAIELDPEYHAPYYNLACAYIKQDDYEKAERLLKKSLIAKNDLPKARGLLIDILCIHNELDVLQENPNDLDSRIRLARAYWAIGQDEKTFHEMEKVLEGRQNDIAALSYLGYACTELGRYDKGAAYLEKAYSLSPNPNLKAWLLYNRGKGLLEENPDSMNGFLLIGESHLHREHFEEAQSYLTKARKLGLEKEKHWEKRRLALKGIEAAKLLSSAKELYNQRHHEEAISNAEQSWERFDEIGTTDGCIVTLRTIGMCYSAQNNDEKALEYFNRAEELAEKTRNEFQKAKTIYAIAEHHFRNAAYTTALNSFQQAKDLFHNNNYRASETWALHYIAYIEDVLGEFERSMNHYEQIVRLYGEMMLYESNIEIHKNLAYAHSRDADFEKALHHYAESKTLAQQFNNDYEERNALRSLANMYILLGDSNQANDYLCRYLDAVRRANDNYGRALAYNDFGLIYIFITIDYDKALEYFTKSRSIAHTIDNKLIEGVANANIGYVYNRLEQFSEALRYHEEGLRLVREADDAYCEMQGLEEIAFSYRELGNCDKAIDANLLSIAIADSLGEKLYKWQYEFSAGKTYEANNNFENALKYYKNAAATLLEIRERISASEIKAEFSPLKLEIKKENELYTRLVDLLMQTGNFDDAVRYIEESKARMVKSAFDEITAETDDEGLNELLASISKFEKKMKALESQLENERSGKEDEAIAALKKAQSKTSVEEAARAEGGQAIVGESGGAEEGEGKQSAEEPGEEDQQRIANLTSTLAETEGEFNRCMLELEAKNRMLYSALSINPTTLGDIQKDIREKVLLLMYFMTPEKLYISCVGKDYFRVKSVEVGSEELSGLVEFFLTFLKDDESSIDEVHESAAILYDYLMKPIEEDMDNYDHIVISPFGILYYLPFHALVSTIDGEKKYAIESRNISYTTSSTFKDILEGSSKKRDRLFALGNPDSSLSGASLEVEALEHELFKSNALIFTLSEATKDKFFKYAKEYDIVHLATHGVLQTNILDSYLLLAGETENEQHLTLNDVAGYTALRDKTDLVFLSACETAIEKGEMDGVELITLARAFAIAGPPTLIATLWKVPDESTASLVIEFYTALKEEKKDKLTSLRDAQLSLLRSEKFSHPFYWAPFLLIGDW
jgi:CHAT domain-containing protein/Flp pilus assembly protein TadD